jgi:hypothetical protein
MSLNYRFISLRLQVQSVLVCSLLPHLTVQNTGLDEFTTSAKLLHGLRLVELLLELLEGTFDVVSLFDLNAEHVLLNWATKIRNNSEISVNP